MSGTSTEVQVDRKAWLTLVARAALAGYQLWRTDVADGPQRLFVARFGLVRGVDRDELDHILEQVGVR